MSGRFVSINQFIISFSFSFFIFNTHPDRTSINQSVGKDAASDDPPPGEGMTYANGCFSGRRLGVPPKVGVSTEVDLFFDSPQPSGT